MMSLFIIIVLKIFASTVTYAEAPPWADKRSDKQFVYGVGMSFKNINPTTVYRQTGEPYSNDYVDDARTQALKNLAATVCGVNIRGEDVDTDLKIEPKYIKGFEIYKVYETKHEYWISFRLSHEMAEKIRDEIKIEKAKGNIKSNQEDFKKVFDEEFK